MFKAKTSIFWILTISIFLILILPNLIQDGMFMDGMLYACVSKNLAHGIGTFWFPHYSVTLYPFFDQQPPLGFGIQSIFFSLFGDSIYVERFYSFLCAVLSALLIISVWKCLFKDEKNIKPNGWLPVLFWITIPVCFWSYSNNVLENTMAVFDLGAILFIVKYINGGQRIINILLAGLFVFLASMTKGIQGTFPLAALFFGWLVYNSFSFRKMLFVSMLLLGVPVFIYAILLQNSNAYLGLTTYLEHRVINSIKNVSEVQNRFYLVGRLMLELLPSLIITTIVLFFDWRKRKENDTGFNIKYKKHILFFLCVGLSASLPLMITLEQRGFYLTTSLPYFALAISMMCAPGLGEMIGRLNSQSKKFRRLKLFSFLALGAVIFYSASRVGGVSRDKEMLNDVYLIGKAIPSGTILGSTRKLWENWTLQEYLVRHFYICQADTITPEYEYILITSQNDISPGQPFTKVAIPTLKFHLYKRNDN